MSSSLLLRAAFAAAIAATVWPLWSAHYLPFVDIPQHLHLINVLGHLDDPNTLYPEVFKSRGEITPYLGYYETVWLFSRVMDVFHANALFLTLVAIAAPVSVAALARQLGGSPWVGILACPFFYGDNLYWGFVNYCASLPLLLFAIALFVAVLQGPASPRFGKELALGVLLIAVQLTHVQAFVYAAGALPLLLFLSPSTRVSRRRALLAITPAVLLFSVWSLGRLGEQPDVAPGEPWKAWGPLLSEQNLSFYPWRQNLSQLGTLLANGLPDGRDSYVVPLMGAVAIASLVLGLAFRGDSSPQPLGARARGVLLAALALALFLFMPFDVRGYMYYVNYRFAELFVLIVIAALPFPTVRWAQGTVVGSALLVSLWYGGTLASRYALFQKEAAPIDEIIPAVGSKPKIMALSFNTASAVVTHPVYLHFASYAAMAHGGITSFSFAATAHSPVAYRGKPPPAPRSEWQPGQFDYPGYGDFYDDYLVRGNARPESIFRGRQNEVQVAARASPFVLYVRK